MPEADAPPTAGLSEDEAQARLAAEGPNELPHRGRRTTVRILIDVLREPMLALLVAGSLIYFALGDLREALILALLAGLSVGITVIQESRSERALEALRDLASPRALVVRGGIRQRIPGRDVVRGDILVLAEGDRVPADSWVVEAQGLHLDESLLTGESVPVRKSCSIVPIPAEAPRAGGDILPYVFSGSLVVGGSGLCVVQATGARSEIGRIGLSLASLEIETPRLYRQTRRLVLLFAAGGIGASLLAVMLYGLLRDNWLEGALVGIALGMALLPEEIPVVLAVFMAMGAMRLSRVRVLARRAAAIETLGSVTVLCTDKTGTLTQNRMSIAELRLPDGRSLDIRKGDVPPTDFGAIIELGTLASAPEPFDPMEIAFHELGSHRDAGGLAPRRTEAWQLRHRYPLDPTLLAVSHLWETGDGEQMVAAKGAPEAIAGLCRLDPREQAAIRDAADAMAAQGLRVLGVAEARWTGPTPPASQREFAFAFRGLVGLKDPLRPSVPDAMAQCRSAGIHVVMITGDYPETARALARAAGIAQGEVVTGPMLAAMDDAELGEAVQRATIFARIMPEQKLRIVAALKAAGEIVGMTGDGVNDAPSLKAAHIGIAMGGRGTDVAREASSIVLLDDDFGSIVTAIRVGRRIFDNLRKAMGFIVAVHIPIAGLALVPLLFGFPILLGPIHIALLEMVIDPVCSLVFESETEEDGIMRRPPREPDSALMSRALLGWSIAQGVLAVAGIAALLYWGWEAGLGEDQLRALAYFALVTTVLSLVLVNRSFSSSLIRAVTRPNRALAAVVAAVALLLLSAQFVPSVAQLLSFAPLGLAETAALVATTLLVLLLLEALKRVADFGRSG
ncbi:MAG: cation-translocating P-type ATPase [Sphingopyxis sp.]|nr:cation-translocating P-type ATPase [Sphingopyxis sp.]MBW8297812.1 cation-translocating P-type ATPase [Sphingopyxis sp.]